MLELLISLPFEPVQFREKLLVASRQGFEKLKQLHANKSFYCFAYCTNGSLGYIVPIVGTEEALTQRALNYLAYENAEHSNLAQIRTELRHNTGDLVAQTGADLEDDIFREVCRITQQRQEALFKIRTLLMNEYSEDAAYKASESYYAEFVALCLSVLRQLDREGVFGVGSARQNVVVNFLFDDQDIESMIKSAQELNPDAVIDKYVQELHEQYPGLVS